MNSTVYLGVWTNWSRGAIQGSTLTTTKAYGNLLISFTAVFIGLVTTRLWKILCLVLHRYYSTANPGGTVHHQRQVILCNSASPEAGLFDVVKLLYAWRRSGLQRLIGLVPLLLFAFTYLVSLTVAGGFSSTISTAVGDEVLIRSGSCGPLVISNNIGDIEILTRFYAEQQYNAANYAQQCYSTGNSSSDQSSTMACNKFVLGNLKTATVNYTSECPFQQKICRSTQSTLRLDSGYIDSNNDLGLNAPRNARVAVRYVMQCTPLETQGYTSHVVESERGWVRYHYGNVTTGPTDDKQATVQDFIYNIEDLDSQYLKMNNGSHTLSPFNFRLGTVENFIAQGRPIIWNPIPELARFDGDLTLIFLSGNGVHFVQEMGDDWYRATESFQQYFNPIYAGYHSSYRPDVAASPMGCLEQWQWCNAAFPREVSCGPLASWIDSIYGAARLFNLTSDDLDPARPSSSIASGTRLIWPSLLLNQYPASLSSTLTSLGLRALASQSRFTSGIQYALPDNQWQLDVLNWWNILLASLQAAFVDTAQGTRDPEFLQLQSPPLNSEEQKICNSQKIRSSAHTSFSFFGLAFTFITGALIIVALYSIEPILACLHRR